MNKIITYDPEKLNGLTTPELFNKELKIASENDKITHITFIQTDIFNNCKNPEKFINDYKDFMTEWDLPYIFFPYYVYFNKLLPAELGKPNPKLELNIKKIKKINVVCVPAYGFLILNLEKIRSINFTFNTEYSELYYIQDLIQKCFEHNLWISNCCFLDRFESWNDLKEITTNGHYVDQEKFNKEKSVYDAKQIQYHGVQEFLNLFKGKYNL